MTIGQQFLESAIKRLTYYKGLGDQTFAQLTDADFHYQPNAESNSIAMIIQHMSGNMLSRWTDFLHSDGEKAGRNRDAEFETSNTSRIGLLEYWNKGWDCCLGAISALTADDLLKTITIRNEKLWVIDAINRQIAHYPYHTGQIIYLGKIIRNTDWQSLSIPRGQSEAFNQQMGKK